MRPFIERIWYGRLYLGNFYRLLDGTQSVRIREIEMYCYHIKENPWLSDGRCRATGCYRESPLMESPLYTWYNYLYSNYDANDSMQAHVYIYERGGLQWGRAGWDVDAWRLQPLVQCMCEHASNSKLPPPWSVHLWLMCSTRVQHHVMLITHHQCPMQLVAHDQEVMLEGLVGVKEMKQLTVYIHY